MKHLMTLVALLVSTAAVAQIPTLPWNPDENGDQFIGLPDLLGLLTVYGQEFENAIVSEDGESAIMYMGEMTRIQCEYACENLPGFWTLPKVFELTPVLEDMPLPVTWLYTNWSVPIQVGQTNKQVEFFEAPGLIKQTGSLSSPKNCYCTAKQLPRVEYDQCITDAGYGSFYQALASIDVEHNECVNSKLAEGWQLMGKTTADLSGTDVFLIQSFWRFAQ